MIDPEQDRLEYKILIQFCLSEWMEYERRSTDHLGHGPHFKNEAEAKAVKWLVHSHTAKLIVEATLCPPVLNVGLGFILPV